MQQEKAEGPVDGGQLMQMFETFRELACAYLTPDRPGYAGVRFAFVAGVQSVLLQLVRQGDDKETLRWLKSLTLECDRFARENREPAS